MSSIAKYYELAKHHALAGASYDANVPDGVKNGTNHEMERLDKFAPVEYAITRRYLQRYIPEGAVVADVGVGAGHYSELLIRRGCTVHLVDVATRLLEATQERLTNAGLAGQILSITHASATDLSFLPDASCDAVLMLGPFYNLSLAEDRLKAAGEAWRVLRPGGKFFAAGINLLTILRWRFADFSANILDEQTWLQFYARTGDLSMPDPDMPCIWHMSTVSEFRANFPNFQEIALVGVESFAQWNEENLLKLSPEQAEAWLDLIEDMGRTPEGLGITGHFLYIGQK